jgi:hypothetical protein
MDKESIFGTINNFTLDSLIMDIEKVQAYGSLLLRIINFILDNFKKIRNMEKENIFGIIILYIRGLFLMILSNFDLI